tara:strand:+ start:1436 stop:1603 length:168 start_codon:yes stop_codon:yes gene_type:complete
MHSPPIAHAPGQRGQIVADPKHLVSEPIHPESAGRDGQLCYLAASLADHTDFIHF